MQAIDSNLPQSVVQKDRALRETVNAGEAATLKLMQLRWHWTKNEDNPNRISIHEYARRVDADRSRITHDVQAYELIQGGAGASTPAMGTNEARERVQMAEEDAAAVGAVAEARGISFSQARKKHRNEASHIRDTARQVASDMGTTTAQEIPKVAAHTYRSRRAAKATKDKRRTRVQFRYLEVEGSLTKARRNLLDAVRASEGVEFGDEERELMLDTLDNVKRLLALLDRAIAGAYDKSWKDELRVLEGGKAS